MSSTRRVQRLRRALHLPGWKPESVMLLVVVLTCAVAAATIASEDAVSHAAFVPVIVLAGFLLSGRRLVRAILVVLIGYAAVAVSTWTRISTQWSVGLSLLCVIGIVAVGTRQRLTMGVPLSVGSSMLKDLRQRLDVQATAPELPAGTRIEHCVLPARGGAFSADFVSVVRRDSRLHVALTDVSGHGPSAAVRALLLSGALSGLLGETEPENFLPAANRYLIRQGWRDGFASAIHVCLDATSGEYCVGVAGHPSAAHFHAATRSWEMLTDAAGLLLGLFEQGPQDYARATGALEPGDVLVLYTDGVVESADGDLAAGTRQLLAMAQSALASGLEGAARRICEASARDRGEDDRSVVVIWRDAVAHDSAGVAARPEHAGVR